MEPASPSSTSAAELRYAPRHGIARRLFARRDVLIALAIIVAVIAGFLILPSQWQAMRMRQYLRRLAQARTACLTVSYPAGTIVFDDDPARSNPLMASGKYVSTHPSLGRGGSFALLPTPAWDVYASMQGGVGSTSSGGGRVAPVVFLHERTSPAGHRRLVVVQFGRMIGTDPFNRLFLYPYADPRTAAGQRMLEMGRTPTETTTLYAGQPDASDASHFTIDYVLNGRTETIDGWFNDDDTVSLLPRCGRITYPFGNATWMPGDAPGPPWLNPAHPAPPGVTVNSLGHDNSPRARPTTMP